MTNEETQMLSEMHTDVKWIKETLAGHLKAHLNVTLAIVAILGSVASGCLVYHFTH